LLILTRDRDHKVRRRNVLKGREKREGREMIFVLRLFKI